MGSLVESCLSYSRAHVTPRVLTRGLGLGWVSRAPTLRCWFIIDTRLRVGSPCCLCAQELHSVSQGGRGGKRECCLVISQLPMSCWTAVGAQWQEDLSSSGAGCGDSQDTIQAASGMIRRHLIVSVREGSHSMEWEQVCRLEADGVLT